MTVEVFKTNVSDPEHAIMLVYRIESAFANYTANFDLEDCDKILRVETSDSRVDVSMLVAILKDLGFDAEVLPDDMPQLLQF